MPSVPKDIHGRGLLSVNRHIKMVHLKLKPYECGLCGIKFSSSGSRTRHEKKACKSRDNKRIFF